MKDLVGMTFGRLTVLERSGKNKWGNITWLCRCSCPESNLKVISGGILLRGDTKSCGCLSQESRSAIRKIRLLPGQKFGRLTIIGEEGNGRSGDVMWRCRCEDDNEIVVAASSLTTGNTKSCGCLNFETRSRIQHDLTGQTFGRLTAIEPCDGPEKRGKWWQCRCSCGNEKRVTAASLRNGHTQSCGCYSRYPVDGINFRSKLEMYFYIAASIRGIAVEYESTTIEVELDGATRRYIPDFKLVENGKLIEIKGMPRELGMRKVAQAQDDGWDIVIFRKRELECWCGVKPATLDRIFSKEGLKGVREMLQKTVPFDLQALVRSF